MGQPAQDTNPGYPLTYMIIAPLIISAKSFAEAVTDAWTCRIGEIMCRKPAEECVIRFHILAKIYTQEWKRITHYLFPLRP